ncbi:MAG: YiiX family permuted papain-like enzyme [Thermoanaerobaculales bacterium]|nr:YiiX family permuted papain-like enzyme [Thermoanaerobaculales bacterium]
MTHKIQLQRNPSLGVPMKKMNIAIMLLLAVCGCQNGQQYEPVNGDIIFHTSQSGQSVAIQKATQSRYSHMGIVYLRDQQAYVFEAVEPVKSTLLRDWIGRGVGGHFVVKRLHNASEVLTSDTLDRMLEVGEAFKGKHYDLYFEWSDDRIYCSELVWKVYKRALDLEIGDLQTISEFDLSDPAIKAKVQERWGGPPPADETVISPAAMFNSEVLRTVFER